jgi:hypothetical protein
MQQQGFRLLLGLLLFDTELFSVLVLLQLKKVYQQQEGKCIFHLLRYLVV